MRRIALLVLVLAAGPAGAEEAEAEKLYRGMEKKILAAKTLAVEFNSEMAVDGKKFTVKGTINIAAGNKTRLNIESEVFQLGGKMLVVTSGDSKYAKVGEIVFKEGPFPPKREILIPLIAEFSATHAALETKVAAADLAKDLPLKNFKLGAKEMVGQQEAQVVQYQLHEKDAVLADVAVWIDTKTGLPLKRRIAGTKESKMGDVTETYSVFQVDSKLDDKLFEIPQK
jgi:outer membrane lipoprotein-sorting protein